jgi:UDPglucose 6-dehydrogenase
MNVSVFGTGYVGLVTAACLAEVGNDVLCVDIDAQKVAALSRGEIPIHEPGLDGIVERNAAAGRLHFTTNTAEGVAHGRILMIAVGTPSGADGAADLSAVLAVARGVAREMREPRILVHKSTVPVGTADRVRETVAEELRRLGRDVDFDVVSNPEFLKEGAAVADFMKPDRIVIGAGREDSARQMRALYAPFNRNHDRVLMMDVRSAELTKYAANVMLASRISLMNELANLADRLGADIESVRVGIGSDPRIGYQFIYAGCGYGGSCFPKDVRALIHTADGLGYPAPMIRSIDDVNERQRRVLFEKIDGHFGGRLSGRRFAVWGLAFKPNTDDMREAPSLTLIEALCAAGAHVHGYDPVAGTACAAALSHLPGFRVAASRGEALAGADALVIMTEWNEFKSPDLAAMRRMAAPVVFDGRNLYDPELLEAEGIAYYAIGRGRRLLAH